MKKIDDAVKQNGAVDSLGIKFNGPVLEGMVTSVDALMRWSTRANPLDPFDVEGETWAGPAGVVEKTGP